MYRYLNLIQVVRLNFSIIFKRASTAVIHIFLFVFFGVGTEKTVWAGLQSVLLNKNAHLYTN